MTSIAVVVLDTLRFDTFQEHFNWLTGKRFSQAYSTTNWTIPAHASLLTGFYASEIGVTAKSQSLDCATPTLPELLQADGYTTRMFTANANLGIRQGWDRGFDQSVTMRELDPDTENTLDWQAFLDKSEASGYERYLRAVLECIRSDVNTIASLQEGFRMARRSDHQRAETILKRARHTDFGDREFLLVNLMDMHTPYDPPEAYRSTNGPQNATIGDGFADAVEDPESVRQAYEDEAIYLSDVYRELFDELRADFEYVITLSDHGEMLGEDGMWNHGYGLYPEITHIPMVVSGDEVESETRNTTVNLLDVHRTIVDIAGIEASSRGQDLLDEPTSRDLLLEYHGLLDSHQQTFERAGLSEELYDHLNTPFDGFATADGSCVYQTHDEEFQARDGMGVDDPEVLLRSLREDLTQREVTSDTTSVSPSTMRHLEDLGYA